MKIATTATPVLNFKYQMVYESEAEMIGVNLIYGETMLLKKRFGKPIRCYNKEDEERQVSRVILEFLKTKKQ